MKKESTNELGRLLSTNPWHSTKGPRPSPNLAKRALQRAIEEQDDIAVMECLILGMEYPVEKSPSKGEFFEPAINYLNRKKEFRWVRAAWLANESKSFFATLSRDQASLLMPAMVAIPKIDFQAEQVLVPIAKLYPDLIWECFAGRLATKRDEEDRFENRYEAIPYQFHGLEKELSKNAKLAVEFGRNLFAANSELFRFRGGRLLKSAFPSCPPNFADELARLAENGTNEDVKFILAILENYQGEQSTHEILKRIVARYPDDQKLRTSVITSLEGTGVVMGEFGFVDALRGKLEIARQWQNDPRAEVRTFGETLARSLELRIADEQRRAEERKALRELEYEVPSDKEGNSDD